MSKSLLVCIAFHYNADRWQYLSQVIINFVSAYKCQVNIIIDTNMKAEWPLISNLNNIEVSYHTNLEHPFHLTGMHRRHIAENIDKYDVFLYVEDDELIPYENYLNYLENFKLLYPKYVPSFIRIEEKNGEEYVSDVLEKQTLSIIQVGGKDFAALPFPQNYCGFWLMPQKELKESIISNAASFLHLSEGREFNAMWTGWGLGKPALVEIENGQVSKKSYSYHLPNNYCMADGLPNGKIKAKEIFI